MFKVIIFGVGSGYTNIKKYMNMNIINIQAFADNNSLNWDKYIDNIHIINPENISRYEYDYIVITSMYYNQITKQLLANGIDQNKVISYYKANKSVQEENIINSIMNSDYNIAKEIQNIKTFNQKINERINIGLMLQAKNNIERIKSYEKIDSIQNVEFKVFSQWGEDGIIQYLIHKLPIKNEIFIEFGVENYTESNTRFLLINNNWSGLVLDGSKGNIDYIKNDDIYWRYNINAVEKFITRDNINQTILEQNISGDIGILSVDIDGNDYWVWEKIECISPRIVICEYNSIFGADEDVTIPYDEKFYRTEAHYSNLYYGVSLKAICRLANLKGYDFIGCNSAGNNAFFVRKDLTNYLNIEDTEKHYIQSKFREGRDENGKLLFISGEDRLKLIKDKLLFNFSDMRESTIQDIYNL